MAGLYIHVPFCVSRCIYCDFYSNTNLEYKSAYISALLHEMELRRDYLRGESLNTIYFGGGTPSQLQSHDYEQLFNGVYRLFSVSDDPEVTIEANPDDLSCDYIQSLKSLPVNRVSVGIQSFVDDELRLLNRRHTSVEAVDAVVRCKDAGLTNISIDLMYGLPGQTVESWEYNLDKAIALDVSHISAYSLTYEEGTAIYNMMERKEIEPADDDLYEQLFRLLTGKLADAGFAHYEVSNFAKRSASHPDGCISLHNSSYWNGAHYLGLGPSAHSYDGDSRSWNISSVSGYIKALNEGVAELSETERLDEVAKYNDFIITRLRTMWGVSLSELRREFGEVRERYFLGKSEPFFCLDMLKKHGDIVKVSEGSLFISDAIMRDLIA